VQQKRRSTPVATLCNSRKHNTAAVASEHSAEEKKESDPDWYRETFRTQKDHKRLHPKSPRRSHDDEISTVPKKRRTTINLLEEKDNLTGVQIRMNRKSRLFHTTLDETEQTKGSDETSGKTIDNNLNHETPKQIRKTFPEARTIHTLQKNY
jgi:hypothetical protein